MPRLFISRLFETFFRRKWLYLLALVPFVALGVVTALNSKPTYKSSGTIQVNRTRRSSTDGATFQRDAGRRHERPNQHLAGHRRVPRHGDTAGPRQ